MRDLKIANIISALSALPAPSGFEAEVSKHIRHILSNYMDTAEIDVIGNVIGVKRCGREDAKKLLLDAHVDEVGLIVTDIADGFLRFSPIGGVDPKLLVAAEVTLLTSPPIYGVIPAMPVHLLNEGDSDKAPKTEDLFIDIGMTQEEARAAVPLGTAAMFNTSPRAFGDNLMCGKALDNRACLAAIFGALELLGDDELDVDLYVMASCQEELGTRGAKTGAYQIRPDYCVVVDVGHGSTPDCGVPETKELGGGVMISVGPNMNKKFTDRIIDVAKKKAIPYQIEVEPGDSGTNARIIQVTEAGVATALVGVPLRYMHSPREVISADDADAAAELLCGVIKMFGGGRDA